MAYVYGLQSTGLLDFSTESYSRVQIDKFDRSRQVWLGVSCHVKINLFSHRATGFVGAMKII